MIQERIYHIQLGNLNFGIVTQRYSDIVSTAAPVAKWTIGKKLSTVLRYYNNRRAIIHVSFIRYYR